MGDDAAADRNALKLQDMAAIQRRVLSFNNPNLRNPGMGATPTLTAALQILKPGEVARPHRHSPSALRFVLEGDGAYTIVDGKECLMNEGDLVITPGWTWHAHEHRGTRPIIWLDSLDVPLHRYFGTDGFEPGPPPNDMPATTPDDALRRREHRAGRHRDQSEFLAALPLSLGAGGRGAEGRAGREGRAEARALRQSDEWRPVHVADGLLRARDRRGRDRAGEEHAEHGLRRGRRHGHAHRPTTTASPGSRKTSSPCRPAR